MLQQISINTLKLYNDTILLWFLYNQMVSNSQLRFKKKLFIPKIV